MPSRGLSVAVAQKPGVSYTHTGSFARKIWFALLFSALGGKLKRAETACMLPHQQI
jgi:hypothetical protein